MLQRRFAVVLLVGTIATSQAAGAADRKLRMALNLPPGSAEYQLADAFKKSVEKATGWGFEIELYPSSQLYKTNEVPAAVSSGAVEIGSILLDDLVGEVPAADIFVQPFMFRNLTVLTAAVAPGNQVRLPLDQAILREKGIRPLWWWVAGSGVVLSKGHSVSGPSAIAGKKVRVAGTTASQWISSCGGDPVFTPIADLFAALKTGRVDIALTSPTVIGPLKLWDVVDTITITRHNVAIIVTAINEQAWQSLSNDHRRIMQEAALEVDRTGRDALEANMRRDLEMAQKNRMNVAEITDKNLEEWRICGSRLIENYLNKTGRLGGEVMSGYRKVLVDAYRTPEK